MSGAVEVLREPDGGWTVACFRTDCAEHGSYPTEAEPWLGDYPSRAAAQLAASVHRRNIREAVVPRCPTCNRPATTATSPSDGAREGITDGR